MKMDSPFQAMRKALKHSAFHLKINVTPRAGELYVIR